jgi:hypothetical protein
MRKILFLLLLTFFSVRPSLAQTAPEGLWQGYDGEWRHVSSQLIALAEATPEEKFSWRPAPGVRSTSEVYMHIAMANFYLLSVTGPKMPADMKEGMEKSVTSKAEVISWLKRSLEAVKQAHLAVTPQDLRAKSTSPIATLPSTACIFASSFTPMSTWGNSSPTRA